MVSPTSPRRNRTLTVQVSELVERRLAERAAAAGQSVSEFVAELVEQTSSLPASLDEALRPVREAYLSSGMSDDELGAFLEEEIDAARKDRRQSS